MATFLFYFGVPIFFGLLQFFLTKSKLPLWKKYIPLGFVALTAAITWSACFDHIPLPETYFFDEGGFISFPDFFYIGLFCFPALLGIMLGALFGVANFHRK